MNFSQDFIDKVRNSSNIVDLLSEYTQFKRSGGRLMGLCPFPGHNEKTPSFSVSEDKQVYHCFGCQRSGQIFTALKELKGLSFPEAVEYLANRAGIIMPQDLKTADTDKEAKAQRENLLKINTFAVQIFHQHLKKTTAAHYVREYCKKRNLTQEIVDTFQIGFAPNEWDTIVNQLQKVNAPLAAAAQLGLIRQRKTDSGYFDLFRDRLMFPIYSHKGACVGFGGRALSDEQTPKYLNSPESELFLKGHTFYGLNETAKYIRTEGSAVIVEGYMDFLALYSAGIKNVVATLGTALTPHHAKLIKRYTANVTVLFDGDAAGINAAERSLPVLLDGELLPKAIYLENGLDPDEFIIEKGARALQSLLKNAPDLFSVILDRSLKEYRGSASEKVILIDKMGPILACVKDSRLRDLYISELAQKIGAEPQWVSKSINSSEFRAKRAENCASVTPIMPKDVIGEGAKIVLNGAPKAELFLLNISLLSAKKFEFIGASGVIEKISHAGVRNMFDKIEAYCRQMPNEFDRLSSYLMTLTETPSALGLHLSEPLCSMTDESLDKFTRDCIRQIEERNFRVQTRELSALLRVSPAEEQLEKIEQIMNLQKSKHTLRRDRES